jgi:PIN domain nuclease of toxin-antitoxin system
LRSSGVLEASIREIVETAAVTVLEITTDIAALTAMFPESYPKDPADRLIGATARALGMTLITQDERILASPLVRSVW